MQYATRQPVAQHLSARRCRQSRRKAHDTFSRRARQLAIRYRLSLHTARAIDALAYAITPVR